MMMMMMLCVFLHRAVLNVCVAYTSRDEMCSAMKDVAEGVSQQLIHQRSARRIHPVSLYIKYGKVSVCSSVMLGLASPLANDVTMRMTSQL